MIPSCIYFYSRHLKHFSYFLNTGKIEKLYFFLLKGNYEILSEDWINFRGRTL